MKRGQRLTLFLLGPAIVGSVLAAARLAIRGPHEVGPAISLLPALVVGAFVLSIIPAAFYATIMELWLRLREDRFRDFWSRVWIRCATVALSTLLGTAAGAAITRVNGNPWVGIGALTGLVLGIYLVLQIFPGASPRKF